MSLPLALEDRLIVACARTGPDLPSIEGLVDKGPDWQIVLEKTELWDVVGLVYASLRQVIEDGVPRSVMEHLRHVWRRQLIYDVARRELLRATLRRLSDGKLPSVLLKDVALTVVYPSPGMRPLENIELLVHAADLQRACRLLGDLNDDAAHIPYIGSAGALLVHLRDSLWSHQHTPARPARDTSDPVEDFWRRARPAHVESEATLVLDHADLLLYLVVDLAGCLSAEPHAVNVVRSLCDLREICARRADLINWRQLVERAQSYHMSRQFLSVLSLAHTVMGAHVPSEVLDLPGVEPELFAEAARQSFLVGDNSHTALSTSPASPTAIPPAHHTGAAVPTVSHRAQSGGKVAVTYDQGGTDGVGSQLARIYGLYACSRALHVEYLHTPLAEVRYQGLMPMLTGRRDPTFESRYNAFFALPSDEVDPETCERVRIRSLDETTLDQFRNAAAARGRPLLLQAHDGFSYLDRHPEAYQSLHAVSPYRQHRAAGPIRVCVHLRRGDMLNTGQTRWLPNSYFLRACEPVIAALRELRVPFVVRLHSEIPPRRYTLYPDTPGLYIGLERPTTIDPAQYALEDFDGVPNLEMLLNLEAQAVLDDFATADVLIPARSDLGFLGGLLNVHGLIIGVPAYHGQPPNWLIADEHGNVDHATVKLRIAALARDRG